MDRYNRLRGVMGYPVDFELGRTIATYDQERRKAIFNLSKNLVLKIAGFKLDPSRQAAQDPLAAGFQPVVFLNGFYYCDNEPYILTAAHALDTGATHFYAFSSSGDAFDAIYQLTFMKAGQKEAAMPGSVHRWNPDVLVFKGPDQPPHPQHPYKGPYGANTSTGDNAYVVGFAGQSTPQLSFNSGIVSCSTLESFTIDTYAEPGYSGSPVFNIDGFLIGMVQSGHDPNGSKQVSAVPATVLQYFLTHGQPCLPGIRS